MIIQKILLNLLNILKCPDYFRLRRNKIRINEYLEYYFLKNKLIKINNVIDVGSNTGQFARIAIELFPETKIFCFEPLKDSFENLIKQFKKNKNVNIYNFALGEKEGPILFYSNISTAMSSPLKLLVNSEDLGFEVMETKMHILQKRLDDLDIIGDNILLKIDVQGYEINVLKGALNTLKYVKIIIIESSFKSIYENQPLFNDLYNFLTEQGFYYSGGINVIKDNNKEILQEDSIYIKKTL